MAQNDPYGSGCGSQKEQLERGWCRYHLTGRYSCRCSSSTSTSQHISIAHQCFLRQQTPRTWNVVFMFLFYARQRTPGDQDAPPSGGEIPLCFCACSGRLQCAPVRMEGTNGHQINATAAPNTQLRRQRASGSFSAPPTGRRGSVSMKHSSLSSCLLDRSIVRFSVRTQQHRWEGLNDS